MLRYVRSFTERLTYLPFVIEELVNRDILPSGYLFPVVLFPFIGIVCHWWWNKGLFQVFGSCGLGPSN
jgi:hypothetical protein